MWQVGDGTRKSHIPILASGLNESRFFEGKSMVWQLNVKKYLDMTVVGTTRKLHERSVKG